MDNKLKNIIILRDAINQILKIYDSDDISRIRYEIYNSHDSDFEYEQVNGFSVKDLLAYIDQLYDLSSVLDNLLTNKSNIQCDVIAKTEQHFTHRDGHFYNKPYKFPCTLHDLEGCICIEKDDFENFISSRIFKISNSKTGEKLNIKGGISSLKNYKKCKLFEKCPVANFRK